MLPVGHGVGQMKIRNILVFNMLSCIMLRMCGAGASNRVKVGMASRKRQSVIGYAGVYFVEALRAAGHGTEKIYYIRYRKQGKLIEEKVGGQYRDNMTSAKAASIRGLRIEGKDASNGEKRAAARAARQAEESRYSFNRIWALFAEAKSANRTIKDDRIRYSLHIAPALGKKSIPELTVHDIDRLRSRLEKAGKSPQTVKHVLTLIKRLLNFALRKGYVEAIPGTLHISMPTVDNKVTENLTPEQARKLLQALDEEPDQTLASLVRLALFTGMISTMKFNKEVMSKSARHGFTNATDAADYLVNHGVPFRDAHGIVGRIVLYCIDKGIAIDDMSLDELKAISPVFEEDIYDAISMDTCVNKRLTIGAPSKEAMTQVIAIEKEYLAHDWLENIEILQETK